MGVLGKNVICVQFVNFLSIYVTFSQKSLKLSCFKALFSKCFSLLCCQESAKGYAIHLHVEQHMVAHHVVASSTHEVPVQPSVTGMKVTYFIIFYQHVDHT